MKRLLLLIFFGCIFLFFLRPMSPDGDVYHHLSTGKYILEHTRIPSVDEWTFTAKGLPWIAHSWGGALLMEVSFLTLGPIGLSILFALAAVLTMILMYKVLRKYSVPPGLSMITLAVVAPLLALRWPTRPESFQFIFFAAVMLIEQYRREKPKFALLFPIIIFLWANVYGASVIFGMGLVIFFYAMHLLQSKFSFGRQSLLFGIVVFVSCICALLNPYGSRTVMYPILLQKIAPYQGEWVGLLELIKTAPVEILVTVQYHLFLYALYCIMLCILMGLSWRIILRYTKELILSLAIFLPFIAFRFLPHTVVLTIPLFGLALSSQPRWTHRVTTLFLLFAIALSLWLQKPLIRLEQDPFPNGIISFIQRNTLSGKIFANQRLGSFLEYNLSPKSSVYLDTRDDLYLPTGTIAQYYETFAQGKSVLPLLEAYHVDMVVADFISEGPSYQPLFYSPGWTPVYFSGRFLLFIRSTLAKSHNISCLCAIDPYAPSRAKSGKERDAIESYNVSYKENSQNPEIATTLATSLAASGQQDSALKLLDTIQIPDGPEGLLQNISLKILRGNILVTKQRCTQAKKEIAEIMNLLDHLLPLVPHHSLTSLATPLNTFYLLSCEHKKI